MHHARTSPISRAGAVALGVLAAVLPLARGGVDAWVEAPAIALAIAAVAAATSDRATVPRSIVPLLVLLCVGALQVVPVPVTVHSLSPGAVRLFEVSLAPLGLYPAARPISLDPAESARALARAIGCTAAFAAAASYAATHRRKDHVILGFALSSVAVVTVVLGLAVVGAGTLLAPRFPFVNANHLAGFLNLTAFVTLGLALQRRGQRRLLWTMAFASAGAVVFLSLSRGGIAAFLFGAVAFIALHVRTHTEKGLSAPSRRRALLATGFAAAAGIAASLALEPILVELRTVGTTPGDVKIRLLSPAFDLVRDFPLLGIGRGAFPTVFAGYQSESSVVRFTHLENEWLQAVIDLGVPAGLLLIGTFFWIWVGAARSRELSSTQVGLLAGTAAVAVHNAVDFSLGIMGVALPFAIAMGLLAGGRRTMAVRTWTLRAGIACALALATTGMAVATTHEEELDRARVEASQDAASTVGAARAALRWHPADWFLQALPGVRLSAAKGCREGMPWLLRAMALDPGAPSPHLAAARCLAGHNDEAAKREYRLAILYGEPALPEAALRYPALNDLFDVAPGTPDGLLALGEVLASQGRSDDASVAYRRAIDEFSEERAILPLAHARATVGDHEGALELARRHVRLRPSDPNGWVLAARALHALGHDDGAHSEIEKGLLAIPNSFTLLSFLAEHAMATRRWSEARRLAEEIAPRSPVEIAGKHLLEARALFGQGRLGEALERARSAAAVDADAPPPWLYVALYAAESARFDEAIAALRRAAGLSGAPPDGYAERIAALEGARRAHEQRLLERRALQGLEPPGQQNP